MSPKHSSVHNKAVLGLAPEHYPTALSVGKRTTLTPGLLLKNNGDYTTQNNTTAHSKRAKT